MKVNLHYPFGARTYGLICDCGSQKEYLIGKWLQMTILDFHIDGVLNYSVVLCSYNGILKKQVF